MELEIWKWKPEKMEVRKMITLVLALGLMAHSHATVGSTFGTFRQPDFASRPYRAATHQIAEATYVRVEKPARPDRGDPYWLLVGAFIASLYVIARLVVERDRQSSQLPPSLEQWVAENRVRMLLEQEEWRQHFAREPGPGFVNHRLWEYDYLNSRNDLQQEDDNEPPPPPAQNPRRFRPTINEPLTWRYEGGQRRPM